MSFIGSAFKGLVSAPGALAGGLVGHALFDKDKKKPPLNPNAPGAMAARNAAAATSLQGSTGLGRGSQSLSM